MLESGANLEGEYSKHALSIAIKNGIIKSVELLLDYGASPTDYKGLYDFSPLHLARLYPSQNVLEAILDTGVDVNAVDGQGATALIGACKSNIMKNIVGQGMWEHIK